MSSIEKNTSSYYIWTIRYDRHFCLWSELSYSTSTLAGNNQWSTYVNYRFLTLTYHSSIANDSTQPDLPEDLNYPNYPPNSYCSMQYAKWRVIISSLYEGLLTPISYVDSPGDNYWRKITPYEYELIQSAPVFCANNPRLPSFSNTIFKYDDPNTYRKFISRWGCDNGSLVYVSGPTYSTNVQEKGSNRWEYKEKKYSDSIYGVVYEIEWVSSERGYGTSPHAIISDELSEILSGYCASLESSNEETITSSINIADKDSEIYLNTGYPVFRVVYDATTKTFGQTELIDICQDNIEVKDTWKFVDIYSESGIRKCVFYYYSSDLQTNKTIEQVQSINKPSTSSINVLDCPCAWEIDVDKVISSNDIITCVLSNIKGKASSTNGIYNLSKTNSSNIWSFSDDKTNIELRYVNNMWSFSLEKRYSEDQYIRILDSLDATASFIGNYRVAFNKNVIFRDEDGTGTCIISFEGNVMEKENVLDSDNSSSSSSS